MFQLVVIALLGFILLRSFTMTEAIDRLTAQVAATTALEASAVALITGIAGQLRDAAGDEAAVNALADQLEQGATGLADAVKANTPAAAASETTGAASADDQGGAPAAGDAGDGTGGGEDTTGATAGDGGDQTATGADTTASGDGATGEGGGEPAT